MDALQGAGYWLWGGGTALLALILAGGYALYRRGAGRDQAEIERRSGAVAREVRAERDR
ncbi:MAG: hypothetical protein KIS73_19790 [Enhydrobacter sp.]|nr:hypothetical protein [Enhydrobacter sp.]